MAIDAETRLQIAVSVVGVGLFIAAAVLVSTVYRVNGHIAPEGGLALVGVLVLFILLMAGAGLWLARSEH